MWRNDDGDVPLSREEREKQKVARRSAQRRAHKLERAKGVIESDPVGARLPFAPAPPSPHLVGVNRAVVVTRLSSRCRR